MLKGKSATYHQTVLTVEREQDIPQIQVTVHKSPQRQVPHAMADLSGKQTHLVYRGLSELLLAGMHIPLNVGCQRMMTQLLNL